MLCYYCNKPPKYSLRWRANPNLQTFPSFCCENHLAESLNVAFTYDLRVEITHAWLDPLYSSEPLKKCPKCQSSKLTHYGSEENPYPNTRCDDCSRVWNQR